VALERDYATKLQLLTRKASEKKARASSAFVIGNEPTKPWDNNTLKQRFAWRHLNTGNAQLELSSTIDAAFDEIIASMSNSAQDHINLADALTTQTIEIFKILEKKNEEVKKKVCPQSLHNHFHPHQIFITGDAILPEVALGPGPLIYRAPQGQKKLNSNRNFVLRV
jgi:hypothetical protein